MFSVAVIIRLRVAGVLSKFGCLDCSFGNTKAKGDLTIAVILVPENAGR